MVASLTALLDRGLLAQLRQQHPDITAVALE
jgi:hypothetical protein